MLNLPVRPNRTRASGSHSPHVGRLSAAIQSAVQGAGAVTDDDLEEPTMEQTVEAAYPEPYQVDGDARSKLKCWIAIAVTVTVMVLTIIIVVVCTSGAKNQDNIVEVSPEKFNTMNAPADASTEVVRTFAKAECLPFRHQYLISNKAEKDEGLCRVFVECVNPEYNGDEIQVGWRVERIGDVDVSEMNWQEFDQTLDEARAESDDDSKSFTITFSSNMPAKGQTCSNGHTMTRVSIDENHEDYLKEGYSHGRRGYSAICDCCHVCNLTEIYHCFECGKEEHGGQMFDKCSECFNFEPEK